MIDSNKDKNFYNIHDIMRFLPHRYPFLLIDRVNFINYGVGDHGDSFLEVEGLKNVTCNENFFVGHFPNNMVMPGVLTLEAMGQLAAFGALQYYQSNDDNFSNNKYNIYFTKIDNVKFKKKIIPGDQLIIKAKKTRKKSIKDNHFWNFHCCAYVDNELSVDADLGAVLSMEDI